MDPQPPNAPGQHPPKTYRGPAGAVPVPTGLHLAYGPHSSRRPQSSIDGRPCSKREAVIELARRCGGGLPPEVKSTTTPEGTVYTISPRRRPPRRQWVSVVNVHHRGRAARPATNGRVRGSRRAATSRSAGGGSSGSDDDSESEPPGLGLWWHPHFGSCSPNLLRALVGEVGS